MSTGIKHIDNACGDLKDGRLYCIACTSYVDRLSILAEVAIGVLSKQTGLAIISNEYERPKLIEKLKSSPRSFTFDDAETLLGFFSYYRNNKGKTSGSRVSFSSSEHQAKILLHKPHPQKELREYQVKQLRQLLEEEGLL